MVIFLLSMTLVGKIHREKYFTSSVFLYKSSASSQYAQEREIWVNIEHFESHCQNTLT